MNIGCFSFFCRGSIRSKWTTLLQPKWLVRRIFRSFAKGEDQEAVRYVGTGRIQETHKIVRLIEPIREPVVHRITFCGGKS